MSDLKRKREEDGPEERQVVPLSPLSAAPPSALSSPVSQAKGQTTTAPTPPASTAEGGTSPHAAGTADSRAPIVNGAAANAKGEEHAAAESLPLSSDKPPPAKRMATPAPTIVICGKEIKLRQTGGRRKGKHPMDALVVLAYKGQLAMACKANSMVSALEIHREMKSKGVKQDLSTHLMVLSLCGGSPGGKDELDPGNGSTGAHVAALAKAADAHAAADAARGRIGGASAQEDTFAAAEAALQIFSDASNGGTVPLPESAYTAVIRACCLDGRADRAREVLEELKRADVKPRVRTYAPLLEAFSKLDGRLQDCMALWREAVSPPGGQGLNMTEREYLYLIAACTRARDEKCFLEVMTEYMDDVLQPRSRQSWDVLKAWFKVGPNAIGNGCTEPDQVVAPSPAAEASEAGDGRSCSGGGNGMNTPDVKETPPGSAPGSGGDGSAGGRLEGGAATTLVEEASAEGSPKVSAAAGATAGGTAALPAVTACAAAPAADANDAKAVAPEVRAKGGGDSVVEETAPPAEDADGGNGGGGDEDAIPPTSGAPVDGDDNMAVETESPSSGDVGGSWSVTECYVRSNGMCENCGEVLRSIDLPKDEEQRLLEQIEVLVCTNEQRTKQWEGFRGWLERRGKQRYNVIIDGANVGYFKKMSGDGELADLRQVDWAVKKFEKEGRRPLVVLHSRHLVEKRLSDDAKRIYKRWKEAGMIQSCAPKNNDDWYWLYAAVYIGGSVLVLTNDEMRDHHFSMLSHRSFERWKERHQARFTFGGWVEDEDESDGANNDDVKDEVVGPKLGPEEGKEEAESEKVVTDGDGKAEAEAEDEDRGKNEEGEIADGEVNAKRGGDGKALGKKKGKADSMRELLAEEPRLYSKRTQRGVDSWHVPLEGSREWLCVRWLRHQENVS